MLLLSELEDLSVVLEDVSSVVVFSSSVSVCVVVSFALFIFSLLEDVSTFVSDKYLLATYPVFPFVVTLLHVLFGSSTTVTIVFIFKPVITLASFSGFSLKLSISVETYFVTVFVSSLTVFSAFASLFSFFVSSLFSSSLFSSSLLSSVSSV